MNKKQSYPLVDNVHIEVINKKVTPLHFDSLKEEVKGVLKQIQSKPFS